MLGQLTANSGFARNFPTFGAYLLRLISQLEIISENNGPHEEGQFCVHCVARQGRDWLANHAVVHNEVLQDSMVTFEPAVGESLLWIGPLFWVGLKHGEH